jgi:hypothetical protein
MTNPDYENYELELDCHGCMFPDYFSGTSGVQLNVYVHNKNTIKEVFDLLREEINIHWEHLEYTLFNAKGKEIPTDMEEKIDEMFQKIEDENDLNVIFSTNARTEEELQSEEETAPFIFSITITNFFGEN